MKRFLLRGTTVLVGASAVALGALNAAPAQAAVSGQLSGWRSPAADTLDLVVSGRSTDTALADATLTVDGVPVGAPATFEHCSDASCTVADASIALDTTDYNDGIRHLAVTIRDANGETNTTPITQDIEFWNDRPSCVPPGSPPGTPCTATLNIGSDPTTEPPSVAPGTKPGGGVEGASATACKSPRLSMSLAQKPLRITRGTPVLLKGKRYRFTGRLTCVVNGKRKSAAKGARIDVRNVVGKKTVRKAGTKVGNGGKITLLLSYPSSRTIEFRYTNGEGKTSKVRIKVRIAQRKS
jgi:hypothetical protein